jgi:PAS domain S-box-containing protein
MKRPLNVLLICDSEDDAKLIIRHLQEGRCDTTHERVDTPAAMTAALSRRKWDIVIADYRTPNFGGLAALSILRSRSKYLPFIAISGAIGEDTVVAAMKAGVNDIVMKDNLSRLIPAIEWELCDAEVRRKRKQSEERFRLTALITTDLIYEWHVDTDSLEWFGDLDKAFGHKPNRIPRTIEAWMKSIHPDDRDRFKEAVEFHRTGTGPIHVEHRIQRSDGSWRYWSVKSTPVVNDSGKNIKWIGCCTDITERRQSEETLREREARLNNIFQAAPVGIGLISDRVLRQVNQRLCSMLGYSPEELIGHDAKMLYLTEKEHEFVGPEKHRQTRDAGTEAVETRWKRKDGTGIDILLCSSAIDPADLSKGVTFTALDISRSKQIERQLAEHNKSLEVTNRFLELKQKELKDFVYTVSHDLKAPLVSLQGFAGLLKEKVSTQLSEEASRYLDRIFANTTSMHMLLQDLLELSRTGRIEEQTCEIDLKAMLTDTFADFSSTASGKKIKLISPGSLPRVHGRPRRVREVLANLIDNAIKYMPEQENSTIEFGCSPHATGRSHKLRTFYVRDNGRGIPEYLHEKVFDVFQRSNTGEEEIPGTGVGLAVAKQIVETHGGGIWLESAPGKGSTFYFNLPVTESETKEG